MQWGWHCGLGGGCEGEESGGGVMLRTENAGDVVEGKENGVGGVCLGGVDLTVVLAVDDRLGISRRMRVQ